MTLVFNYLPIFLVYSLYTPPTSGAPECEDFLMEDVCMAYMDWGKCFLHEARLSCRLTCGVCAPGWSAWSNWGTCSQLCDGQHIRTRFCKSSTSNCPGDDIETESCKDPSSICVTTSSPTTAEVTTAGLFSDEEEFLCLETEYQCENEDELQCIDKSKVCDGYDDCSQGSDEEITSCSNAGGSNDTFMIKSEYKQVCMEVIVEDPKGPINGVRAYRRCPSLLNPQKNLFMWRWWQSFHLINLETGRCLEVENPAAATAPKLTSRPCKSTSINQKFVCEDRGSKNMLVRLRKIAVDTSPRYISLGEDETGWPLVLSSNHTGYDKYWNKWPQEPPATICKSQVYWSDWSSWSGCSQTCVGGRKSHSRMCIGGPDRVPPCSGPSDEDQPCNGNIACSLGPGYQNSNCLAPWKIHDNIQSDNLQNPLDPSCYRLFKLEKNYTEARVHCKQHGSFLASIKNKEANDFVVGLLDSDVTKNVYIGIEENFYSVPVQSHYLRYDIDNTPVGNFKPWEVDCVLGEGYDYTGTTSETWEGISCQPWNENTPHTVNFKPYGSIDHNFCRNPNMDLKGPWCYTMEETIEKDYCEIPQCTEAVEPNPLSDFSQFRLGYQCLDNVGNYVQKYSFLSGFTNSLIKTDCFGVKANILGSKSELFVWDATRSRIIHYNTKKCIEASEVAVDAQVSLQTCDGSRVNQKWKPEGDKMYLDYSKFNSELHLDVSLNQRDIIVSSSDTSAWTVSTSAGHHSDWAKLRKLPEDDSFQLYNIESDKCLGVNVISEYVDLPTSPTSRPNTELILMKCQFSPSQRWLKLMGTVNLFMHLQTSYCMVQNSNKEGSRVVLRPCNTGVSVQEWKCNNDLTVAVKSSGMVLRANRDHAIVTSKSSTNSKWIIWRSKNRTVCDIQSPRGNVATGAKFSIKNAFNQLCIKTDETGHVFTSSCNELGFRQNEIWRFTESPTMIMHYETRRCLKAHKDSSDSNIISASCNLFDPLQHWTLYPRDVHINNDIFKYYSIHLLLKLNLVMSFDGKSSGIKLRSDVSGRWHAFNKFSVKTELVSTASCAYTNQSNVFYNGNISTTKTGKTCNSWTRQQKIKNPEFEEKFCRVLENIDHPSCYVTTNSKTVLEECIVPKCPTAKVTLSKNGYWNAVNGKERLFFVCQAEPECYRGSGYDYIGSTNHTAVGACVNWNTHLDDGLQSDHNFCRNLEKSEYKPWCYTNVAKAVKQECSLSRCSKTCRNIPLGLYKSETIQHTFSAASYGLEMLSEATLQCHHGYWMRRGDFRHEMQCINHDWVPAPTSCKMVTCGKIQVSVPGTILTSIPLSSVYGYTLRFLCQGQKLAGPSKIAITFECDELGRWKKEDNHLDQCLPPCDDGWRAFRDFCYKVFPEKQNFTNSLSNCHDHNATLADLDDKVEFDFLKDLVISSDNAVHGSQTLYWVGVKHFPKTPPSTDPMWRDYRSINALNKIEEKEKKGANYLPFLRKYFYVMHYMHNRHTKEFDDILAYNERCMYADKKYEFVASKGCKDFKERQMYWMWVSPYHLYNIATKKCLTGFAVNGDLTSDLKNSATVTTCDVNNKNQWVGCRRHGYASLKLLLQENSYFVDDLEEPWDKVRMGGSKFNNMFSRWVLNYTDYDICHHSLAISGNVFLLYEGKVASGKSYSYPQAQTKCRERGGEIATVEQITTYMNSYDINSCACAWAADNSAYSVMKYPDSLCSAGPGVVACSLTTPGKADVWCNKGPERLAIDVPWVAALWLDSSVREGVQERESVELTKSICMKESRWHCPDPPDIYRALLKENILTSYSYTGTVMYECDEGYWFERGKFTEVLLCSPHLTWNPDPQSLICRLLDCPIPTDIAHANLSYATLHFEDKATYSCHHGYWFHKDVFTRDVTCWIHAQWFPSADILKCSPVVCNPPYKIEYAYIDAYTYSYPYNATYICQQGYWFAPNETRRQITCNADGVWSPDPVYMKCWEIICPPPPDQLHATWRHIDRKTTNMGCEPGFEFRAKNPGLLPNDLTDVTLECGNDGNWSPNALDYLCIEVTCPLPSKVNVTDNDINPLLNEYESGNEVTYHCHPGNYLLPLFTPFSLSYDRCFWADEKGFIFASEEVCGTARMINLRWEEAGDRSGVSKLVEAETRRCVGADSIPTLASSEKVLRLSDCNGTDVKQNWFCNEHGVSDLILGLNGSQEFYISINLYDGRVHTTNNKLKGVELLAYHNRLSPTELDLCTYRERHYSQTITCLKLGGWTPPTELIRCFPIVCDEPPDGINAEKELLTEHDFYPYASSVEYRCKPGHKFLLERNTFVSRCSDLSLWVPDPLNFPCDKVVCPRYIPPIGAIVTYGSLLNVKFGSKMVIACRLGFHFAPRLDSIQVSCGEHKTWIQSHNVGECKALFCPKPPDILHGTVTSTGNYLYNSLARYVCNNGYTFNDQEMWKESFCMQDSVWLPDPTEFVCEKIECVDPGEIPNTIRDDGRRESDSYDFGSIVYYKCMEGMWYSPGHTKAHITCRDDGNWYPLLYTLYCVDMMCNKPNPVPSNSHLVGLDYSYESSVTILCQPGYRIGGNELRLPTQKQITCNMNQEWEPDIRDIKCLPIQCDDPPKIPHSHQIKLNNVVNSYVQYMCDTGYWILPGLLSLISQCSETGRWLPDPSNIKCNVVDCGHPGTFFNANEAKVENSTKYGAVAMVSCRDGYWVKGEYATEVVMQCSRLGLWEPPPENIHCESILCSEPSTIPRSTNILLGTNLLIDVTSLDPITGGLFYQYGVQLEYKCNYGYEFSPLRHKLKTTCSNNGTWSIDMDNVNCTEIYCYPPPAIVHGYVSLNNGTSVYSYLVGFKVEYTCDIGYWFNIKQVNMTVTCGLDGKWSVDLKHLACIRVKCDDPISFRNGSKVVSGNYFAHTVRYFCDPGFKMTSENVMSTCDRYGNWTPTVENITCVELECGDLPTIPNVEPHSAPFSRAYGATVRLQCLENYYFQPGVNESVLTCNEDGRWYDWNIKCFHLDDFECDYPPYINNSYFSTQTARKLTIKCDPGFMVHQNGVTLNAREIEMTCNHDGSWEPYGDITCEEIKCFYPAIDGPFYVYIYGEFALMMPYAEIVNLRCLDGNSFAVIDDDSPTRWMKTVNITCNATGNWTPELSLFRCELINCTHPPEIENGSVTFDSSLPTLPLDYEVTYTCDGNMSFGDSVIKSVTCFEDKTWQPNPADFHCQYHKCKYPIPPEHSTISITGTEYLNSQDVVNRLQELVVVCNTGYKIFGESTFTQSVGITCDKLGNWNVDLDSIYCTEIYCYNPTVPPTVKIISNTPLLPGQIHSYMDTVMIKCPENYWFSPPNVTHQTLTCWWDEEWKVNVGNMECKEVQCGYPPHLQHSTMLGFQIDISSEWTYYCDHGYRFAPGVFSRNTSCQLDGSWNPLPGSDNFTCTVIACKIPPLLPNVVNISLISIQPGHAYYKFREGSNFTYSCEAGYWMSFGRVKETTLNVTCSDGQWLPEPETYIKCVVVVCDTIYEVEGARADGLAHVYNSIVTYSCAYGQYFAKQRQRRLNSTCLADGRWHTNPLDLWCSDVFCDDLHIEHATKEIGNRKMGSVVIYSCPYMMWFSPNVTQISASCGERGYWMPSLEGQKCVPLGCGAPKIDNIMLVHTNFTYSNHLEVYCQLGYYLQPASDKPPLLICDTSAVWFPNTDQYTCIGIECNLPRYIRNARIIGNNTYNSTVQVRCEPGYYIRRGVNYIEATCLHDETWTENLNDVICLPFTCETPTTIQHSSQTTVSPPPSPSYNSVVKYMCDRGYWMNETGDFEKLVRCTDTGLWSPQIDFKCFRVKCVAPSEKRNSVIDYQGGLNLTSYDMDHILMFKCNDYCLLSAQYALGEWAYTGLTEVHIVCESSGLWRPSPHSFACRTIAEGPVPVGYHSVLDNEQVLYQEWLADEQFIQDDLMNNTYLTIEPTGETKWYDGTNLPNSMAIDSNYSAPESSASMLLDGDPATSWQPSLTTDRHYSATVYMGGLYEVKGLEMSSGSEEDVGSVVDFQLQYSSDGKLFNQSTEFSTRGRSGMTSPIVKNLQAEKGTKYQFENFNGKAKFVQITVLSTKDISYPPNVQTIQFLATPFKWIISYPVDYVTMPIFIGVLILTFLILVILAKVKDNEDLNVYHFGWDRIGNGNLPPLSKCCVIKLHFSDLSQVKTIVCRLDGVKGTTSLMVIDELKTKYKQQVVLILPTHIGELRRFDIGYIGSGHSRSSRILTNNMQVVIKIGEFKKKKLLYGRMKWLYVKDKITLYKNEPTCLHLYRHESRQYKNDKEKVYSLNPIFGWFYHVLYDHLLYTIFIKDFLTQSSRLERSLVLIWGCFFTLATTFSLYHFNYILKLMDIITCFGLGSVSAIMVIPFMSILMVCLLLSPVYSKPKNHKVLAEYKSDLQAYQSGNYSWGKSIENELNEIKSKYSADSIESTLDSGDWSHLGNAVGPFPTSRATDNSHKDYLQLLDFMLKFKTLNLSNAYSDLTFPSITDSLDSCLVPARFRGTFVGADFLETDSDVYDLDKATRMRKLRIPRRTRSCPAIMQFLGHMEFESRTNISLPDLPSIQDDDDTLSCASMFSAYSMVEDWHQVHTRLNPPLPLLFPPDPSSCKSNESRISWYDPTYRRIPSNISRRGFGDPKPISRSTLLQWKKEAPLHLKIKPVEKKSAVTQFPVNYRIGIQQKSRSTQYTPQSKGDTSVIPQSRSELPSTEVFSPRKNTDSAAMFYSSHPNIDSSPSHLQVKHGDMALRNRLHKKVVAFSNENRKAHFPIPSSGQKSSHSGAHYLSSEQDNLSSNLHPIESSLTNEEVNSLHGSLLLQEEKIQKREFFYTTHALKLRKVSCCHRVVIYFMVVSLALSIIGSSYLSLTTIDKTSEIICLYCSSLIVYFILTLPLEAAIRKICLEKQDRISLAKLCYSESSSETVSFKSETENSDI